MIEARLIVVVQIYPLNLPIRCPHLDKLFLLLAALRTQRTQVVKFQPETFLFEMFLFRKPFLVKAFLVKFLTKSKLQQKY